MDRADTLSERNFYATAMITLTGQRERTVIRQLTSHIEANHLP